MAQTIHCRLVQYLEYLTSEQLKKFKQYLVDCLPLSSFPKGDLEGASPNLVADLLVNYLGEQKAWEVALRGWDRMGLRELREPVKKAPEVMQANATDELKLCSHEDFQRLRKKMAGQIYPVMEKESRTRLALIICNMDFYMLSKRNGAEHDIRGMKDLLEGLGYSVVFKENLKAWEMESVLLQFASRSEHRTSDSTFLVLMSHGVSEGICGTDHTMKDPHILPLDRIFQIFNTSNCPSLKDKPKIIILQACRGDNLGYVLIPDSAVTSADRSNQALNILESDSFHKAHVEKDFIAFCSSTPDNLSWRSPKEGSLFIIQLIRYFRKNAWHCHLYDIFCKVQQSFEERKDWMQMPTIERATLTKHFYLFPGN